MGSPSMGSSAAMRFRLRPALQFRRDYFVELVTATATVAARRSRANRFRRGRDQPGKGCSDQDRACGSAHDRVEGVGFGGQVERNQPSSRGPGPGVSENNRELRLQHRPARAGDTNILHSCAHGRPGQAELPTRRPDTAEMAQVPAEPGEHHPPDSLLRGGLRGRAGSRVTHSDPRLLLTMRHLPSHAIL